jgi:hypothetical protein
VLWDEVDVESELSDAEIARRMAPALGLAADRIEVVSDIGAKASAPGIEARIEATRRKGQFPLRLGIYFVGKREPSDRAKAQDAVARSLGARILVSDGGVDPYTRTAIDPKGRRSRVNLEVESLDEKDQLRIDDRFILKGENSETKLDPARSLVVGRGTESGLQVNHLSLSKRHFELRFADGGWVLEDLGSASGTYVNDRLARGPTPISRGDRIKAGGTVFTLS